MTVYEAQHRNNRDGTAALHQFATAIEGPLLRFEMRRLSLCDGHCCGVAVETAVAGARGRGPGVGMEAEKRRPSE